MEIICVPADKKGNKLFLKDFRVENKKYYVKYKSTYNDISFMETEIYLVENNFVITGDNGIALWVFAKKWLLK